jgi:hypothetical protein
MSTEMETLGQSGRDLETAAPHPEEMRLSLNLTLGSTVSLKASARATPAGLIAAALLVASIVAPSIWLLRSKA